MSVAVSTKLPLRQEGTHERVVYCVLLPLFVLVLGAQRLLSGTTRDVAGVSRRSLWAEAKSQASIATSYALWTRSLLHSSERKARPERLS